MTQFTLSKTADVLVFAAGVTAILTMISVAIIGLAQ